MCVEISKIGFQIRCFSWHVAPRPHGSHGPVEDAGCFSRTLIEYWPRSDFVKKGGNILLNAELLVISINQAISFIDKRDFGFEFEDLTPLCWYFLFSFHIGFQMIFGIWRTGPCLRYNHYHPPQLKWILSGTFSEESNTDLCIWRSHQLINLYHFSHDYTISNCNGDWRDSRSTNKLKSHALFGQKKSVVNFNVVSGHRGLGTP